MRLSRDCYAAETALLTGVLDAETLFACSRNDLTSAKDSYRAALARYMRVTGR